jgi:hypothetical protein
MSFDPHVALNEELPEKKYESYSMTAPNLGDTLDEPVLDTVVHLKQCRKEISSRYTIRSQ